ncbi:hypothetical protein [Nitrosopumilus sp. S4]
MSFDEDTSFQSDAGSDNNGGQCVRQKRLFEKLTNTDKDDWTTVSIIGRLKDAQGREYYQFSLEGLEDYEEIEPFFDLLEKEEPDRLGRIKQEHEDNKKENTTSKARDSCQYCGHGMIYEYRIKNDKKKLIMTIGSHCIEGFDNVDPALEHLRKRDEKTLRDAMRKFIPEVSNQIWTDRRFALRIYKRDGVEKMLPKQKHRDYYNLLKELDVDNCSVQELKETFKKIDNLEFIRYPEFIEDIVHPQLAKKKHGGLDEFFWR